MRDLRLTPRWYHLDGRLTICKQHFETIERSIGARNWRSVDANDLADHHHAAGEEWPCDLCELDHEATLALRDSTSVGACEILDVSIQTRMIGEPLDI